MNLVTVFIMGILNINAFELVYYQYDLVSLWHFYINDFPYFVLPYCNNMRIGPLRS